MKKTLSIIVAVALVLSAVSVTSMISVSADNNVITDKHTVYDNPNITIEKAGFSGIGASDPFYQYGGGIVNVQNGRIILSGQTEAIKGVNNGNSKSLWVTTKGLTGKKLEDYTLKYSYIPASDSWNVDAVLLRVSNSASPDRFKGYTFGVQGNKHQASYGNKPLIWIQKDSSSQITSNPAVLDSSKAVYKEFDLKVATEYTIEISVSDCKVQVWIYKAGSSKPKTPTISYIDSKASYSSGDIAFATRDEGYSISDITLVDATNNKTIVKNYAPAIYNSEKLDFTVMSGGKISGGKVTGTTYNTGNVSLVGGKLKLSNENGMEKTTYTDTFVRTNALSLNKNNYFSNFELCFVAAFADKQENTLDVYFNSYLNTKEYTLSLDKAEGKVKLYKDGDLLTSVKYTFKSSFDYQIILSKSGGKVDIYIYEAGTKKPNPCLTYTDSNPLSKGTISFGTQKGEIIVDDIALQVKDDKLSGIPFYTLDFESGMEDAQLVYGEKSFATEGDNTYLSVKRDSAGDGKSLLVFGPQDTENFTINLNVRITENKDSRWFYFGVKHHANDDALADSYHTQIFRQGSSIAAANTKLGYAANNHKLGMSGSTPSNDIPNPVHDYNCGIHSDGEWHKVSIVSNDFTISLYIDGKLIVTAKDPDKLYKAGGFGIYTWGVNYDVDNIHIYSDTNAIENDLVQLGPTGLLFKKDFEGTDRNKNGLDQTRGHIDKTVVMKEKDGNNFLRVIGERSGHKDDLSGTDAVSRIHFGSNYIRNFDFSARVRFKSAFSTNWSWISVAVRSDFSNYTNKAVCMNIGPLGSSVSLKEADLGYDTTSNIVATTGNVATTTQHTAHLPDDNRDNGIQLDGRWHDIKVTGRGYTFTLYIDGEKILTYTDHEQTYARGAIYLYGYGVNYDLDDILVTNYEANTPKAEPVNTVVYSDKDGFTLDNNKVSKDLLSNGGVKNSKLGSFEWQFDYKAGSSAWGRTTFMFHTTKNATIKDSGKKFSDNKNVFALTIAGTGINSTTGKESVTNNIKNSAITCLVPNQEPAAEKELVAIGLEQAGAETNKKIPAKDAYLSLAANKSLKAINVNEWMTVNIRLIGNKLYVCVWQTNNKQETFRRTMFTLPVDTIKALSAGDFAVSNGDNKAYVRNIVISNEDLYFKASKK